MDIEKRARRQSLRVIISEILMVIAVIATVSILAFVVSGYWVGSNFQIERQGLLQIYSSPTGADVEIDGNPSSWFQRTNTSKTLAAGEHNVVLTKDGYDSWSRTVNITEGLLYRLHYPRLFLKNRSSESALDFSGNFASVSPDRNTMLLFTGSVWQLFNLDSDSAKPTTLEIPAGLISGTIRSANWASDNEHVLLELESEAGLSWVILNVKNPSTSVDLAKDFNAKFTKIKILDSSASSLLAILNGNLHRIDVSARQISAILVPDVVSFDYRRQDVIFTAATPNEAVAASSSASAEHNSAENNATEHASAENNATEHASTASTSTESAAAPYYLGLLKLGSNEITNLKALSSPAFVVTTRFYDDEYIGLMSGADVAVYQKANFEEKAKFTLTFTPEKIRVTNAGDAIIMNTGEKIASLDMEVMKITEWSPETLHYGWLDGSMIYAVKDGRLTVYDFNSLNPRELATGVTDTLPVTITSDKYLYYFKNGSLIREYLYEK